MDKVIKYRAKDRWGKMATFTRTEWVDDDFQCDWNDMTGAAFNGNKIGKLYGYVGVYSLNALVFACVYIALAYYWVKGKLTNS